MVESSTSYLDLADELEGLLTELGPGARMPSENELAARHQLSRITTRAALQELEQRHLVRRHRGSGSFVAFRIPYPLRAGALPSWSQVVEGAGHEPSYQVLSVERRRAPAAIATALLLPRRSAVVRLVRMGLVDGLIAAHQSMWFAGELVPELEKHIGSDRSMTSLLASHYGIELDRWWSRSELLAPPAPVAGKLELVGRPLAWRTETVNRCRRLGRPVEAAVGWMRADCFRVFVEVGPSDGTPRPTEIPSGDA